MRKIYSNIPQREITDLRNLVKDAARNFGDRSYLKYKRNGAIQTLSFKDLDARVDCLSAAIFEMGLSGKAVGVVGESSPEWIITYLACVNSGCIIVPLDRELNHEELCGFLQKVHANAVFFSPSFTASFEAAREKLPEIRYFAEFPASKKSAPEPEEAPLPFPGENGGIREQSELSDYESEPLSEGFLPFEKVLARGRVLLESGDTRIKNHKINMDAVCAILFTSGTTGTSKGVMLSQKNLTAAVNCSYRTTDFRQNDVLVSVLPLHHTYEMTCGILTPILIGCTVCINESLKTVLKSFQVYRPTGVVLVPLFVSTIYKKIWDTAEKTGKRKMLEFALKASGSTRTVGIDLRRLIFRSVRAAFGGRLKKIICGGAPLEPDHVQRFDEIGINLCEGYGITECAPLIAVNPPFWKKYHSVGLPVPTLEVMIDKSQNADNGEILVKGPNVMVGYYGDAAATAAAIQDGWFHTGDCGYLDDDGFLYVTGRSKNVIVLNNGKNVFPEEIEEYLAPVELVSECAVVGRTGTDGQVSGLTAIIYPDFAYAKKQGLKDIVAISAAIKEEVALVNKTLPAFKQIRGIEIRQTEFQKTTTKKIKRHKINEES